MNPLEKLKDLQAASIQKVKDGIFSFPVRVYVGDATCENAAGAQDVYNELMNIKSAGGLKDVYIGRVGCTGRCNQEPIVQVFKGSDVPVKYCRMTPEKMRDVVEKHIQQNNVIEEWTL